VQQKGRVGSPTADGCDEAVLLADDVTVGRLAELVIDGFATMRVTLNGREKSINLDEDQRGRPAGSRRMSEVDIENSFACKTR
jgi:hypothetical protein